MGQKGQNRPKGGALENGSGNDSGISRQGERHHANAPLNQEAEQQPPVQQPYVRPQQVAPFPATPQREEISSQNFSSPLASPPKQSTPSQFGTPFSRHIPQKNHIPHEGKAANERLHKISRSKVMRLVREIVAGVFVLGLVTVIGLYAYLSRGPVHVNYLVPYIERAINAELDGVTARIESAVFRRSPERLGIQFRLKNIRLLDAQGSVIAQAPEAAIGIAPGALLYGRLAPSSVELIGPRFHLSYKAQQGLSLAFFSPPTKPNSRASNSDQLRGALTPGEKAVLVPDNKATRQASQTAPAIAPTSQSINLGAAIAEFLGRGRAGLNVAADLTRFGIRNATVIFDHDGRRESLWRIPKIDIRVVHEKNYSALEADALVKSVSAQGWSLQPKTTLPWKAHFSARLIRKSSRVGMVLKLTDLNPASLAGSFPIFAFTRSLHLPVTVEARGVLEPDRTFRTGDIRVAYAQGHLNMPWGENNTINVERGHFRITYDGKHDQFWLHPTVVRWGYGNYARVSGMLRSSLNKEGQRLWSYQIAADEAAFSVSRATSSLPPIRIDTWSAKGTFNALSGELKLSQYYFRAGDAEVQLTGKMTQAPDSAAIRLTGHISPMRLDTFRSIWPDAITPAAREWVDLNILAGRVDGGRISIDIPGGMLARLNELKSLPARAIDIVLGFSNLIVRYDDRLPAISIPKATASLRGHQFSIDLPAGSTGQNRSSLIHLSKGRYEIKDWRPVDMKGTLRFKVATQWSSAMKLLAGSALPINRPMIATLAKINGKLSGRIAITTPVTSETGWKDVKIKAKGRLKHLKAKDFFGRYDVTAGTIELKASEKALELSGEVLLSGVPAQIAGQYIFDAPAAKQPPLRIAMHLNQKARKLLGFHIDHIVNGTLPLHITIASRGRASPLVQFVTDLNDVELNFAPLGWRKARARPAQISFTLEETRSGKTRLKDVRLVGEDLNASGYIILDKQNNLSEFFFKEFSPNFLTHLQLSGLLRKKDGVLAVRVRGKSFDGKVFFRSLFTKPTRANKQAPSSPVFANIDLDAKIDSIIGFSDTTLKQFVMKASHRNGRLSALRASGRLNGHAPLNVRLKYINNKRVLIAETRDAGSAFRLVGFYPRVVGGEASLKVYLDRKGYAEKTGTLWVRKFNVLGDEVLSEVVSTSSQFDADGNLIQKRRPQKQRIYFDKLKAPFSIGQGQFVLRNAYVNGPLMGATLRGHVDFDRNRINLGGTYIPAYGLNAALGNVPLLGQLLVGRSGEGVFGLTFGIKGRLQKPTVLINPVSAVTPGIFRQIFDFTSNKPKIIPKKEKSRPASKKLPRAKANSSASSVFEEQ